MNKLELEKLRVMYDDENNCWAITNNPRFVVSDNDMADDLGLSLRKYFNMLVNNGGVDMFHEQDCVGFSTEEIAVKCLEVIRNYKEDDIIEKVEQVKSENKNMELNKEECETLLNWYQCMLYGDSPNEEDNKLFDKLEKYIKTEEI